MKSILLTSLLLSAVFSPSLIRAQDQPQSQTATETEKKKGGGFGRFMKGLGEVAKEVVLINGQPIGSSSGGNSGSGSGFGSFRGKAIEGRWDGMGAGGGGGMWGPHVISPRNHHYTFDVTANETDINVQTNASPDVEVKIWSPNGQELQYLNRANTDRTFHCNRPGTYSMIIWAGRDALSQYSISLNGAVANIQRKQFVQWSEKNLSFGDEGGGGGGGMWSPNDFSPRNYLYKFEPEQNTYFDITAESNGVPIKVRVVDPIGRISDGVKNGPGVAFTVEKAEKKGDYYFLVATEQVNGQGNFKLDVFGTFKQQPTLVRRDHQRIKAQFTPGSKRHSYTIPAKTGAIEIMYRSTTTGANFQVLDAFNQTLEAHFDDSPTDRLHDRSIQVKADGNLTLLVETAQQTNVGEYELLLWGNFDGITGQQIKTPVSKPVKQAIAGYRTGQDEVVSTPESAPTTVAANQVTLSGQVKSRQAGASYTTMHVVYEDLETGERVGEVIPDAVGTYTIIVSRGKRYGITALTEEGTIASSQNIDLTRTTPGSLRVPVIDVVETEVGESINLNNIFFQTGKATLLPASYAELNRIGKFLKDHPGIRIEIAGHTDNQGSAPINKVLSTDRALAVAYNLQGQQIKQDRVSAVGYGPAKPVAPNTTENGRAMNRRVEFRIVGR